MLPQKIFYSFRVQEELKKIENNFKYGMAHYSYKVVKNRFIEQFEENGIETEEIIRPEIYKHPISFNYLKDFNSKSIHFIVKPFEELRVLKNAYNIAHIAWEFDKINTHSYDNIPFTNYKRMLNMLDEVWVPCKYTKEVFERHGVRNVHFVPTHIPFDENKNINKSSIRDILKGYDSVTLNQNTIGNYFTRKTTSDTIVPFEQSFDSIKKPSKIYLTIANPHDRRKNLPAIIQSFINFNKAYPDTLLVVKLVIDNTNTKLEHIFPILHGLGLNKFKRSNNIIFISEQLTDINMKNLMSSIDNYISLSYCEGQNLPLLEAMALGKVPIAVNNTAMADYINKENSFIVDSSFEKALPSSNGSHNPDLYWYKASVLSAEKQLKASYEIAEHEYQRKSNACRNMIEKSYSKEATFKIIKDRFNQILKD